MGFLNSIVEDRNDSTLSLDALSEFVSRDPILKKAADAAFVEYEENAYCDPFVDANANPYTVKAWERILAIHGYVLKHDPNAVEIKEPQPSVPQDEARQPRNPPQVNANSGCVVS